MTPTEQDKELRDRVVAAVADAHLRALQEKHPIDTVETLGPVANDTANQLVDQLITADRKRATLDARIDEAKLIAQLFVGLPTKTMKRADLKDYLINRIAELKAQQEEV